MSCHMQMWSRRMTSHDISHCCRAEWRYYNGLFTILMTNYFICKYIYIYVGHSSLDTPMLSTFILDSLILDTHLLDMLGWILLKSKNLQYNNLGRWVDHLIDQVSDGPSISLLDCKEISGLLAWT